MSGLRNRVSSVGQVLPFTEKDYSKTYYQVMVGQYGIVITKNYNPDTEEGLQLIKGKASVIEDEEFAMKIAESSGGKLIRVSERYTRVIEYM